MIPEHHRDEPELHRDIRRGIRQLCTRYPDTYWP